MDPAAVAYKRALEARMGNTPVGEVPMPPVPVLDEDAPDRPMTMAEAATRQRADQHAQATGGIFQRPSSMPKLLPTDLLAEEARGDPQFIRGHGDMLAKAYSID